MLIETLRICPGQHLANRSLFITTALTLWAFRISQVADSPIDTYAFSPTVNIHPSPFRVNIEPRFPPSDIRQFMKDIAQ
jgi:hypothetical protein